MDNENIVHSVSLVRWEQAFVRGQRYILFLLIAVTKLKWKDYILKLRLQQGHWWYPLNMGYLKYIFQSWDLEHGYGCHHFDIVQLILNLWPHLRAICWFLNAQIVIVWPWGCCRYISVRNCCKASFFQCCVASNCY